MRPGHPQMDDWLGERLDKYDRWLEQEQIDYSAKVIPVRESIEVRPWVLPTEQVFKILEEARFIALAHCLCRTHYGRCDNPREVCLLLNDYGRKFVESGSARRIDQDEARSILRTANEKGLVHLSLYRPDHQLYALCSCCSCCCHDLQLFLKYGQDRLIAHSDYTAETDGEICINCGECEARCVFGARTMQEGRLVVDLAKCRGCGLCVTICPVQAVVLKPL